MNMELYRSVCTQFWTLNIEYLLIEMVPMGVTLSHQDMHITLFDATPTCTTIHTLGFGDCENYK